MKKVTTKLPAGRIVEIKELADGTFKIVQEVAEEVVSEPKVVSDDDLILIGAESLSLNDRFMKHKPRTIAEEVISENKLVSEDNFILIEAENLSLNDTFMKHKPCTKVEEIAKKLIIDAIKAGVKNFYRPIMDPSFTDDGICYVAGKMPAVGKSYN